MSIDVLGLRSSAVTELQALPSQVPIAIGLKKKKKEKKSPTELFKQKYSLQANKVRSCPFVQSIVAKSSARVVFYSYFSFFHSFFLTFSV